MGPNDLPTVVPAGSIVPEGMFDLALLYPRLDEARRLNYPVRLLVTGSRDWVRGDLVGGVISRLPPGSIVVHGGASGADSMAEYVVQRFMKDEPVRALTTEVHRANWSAGKKAGPLRNSQMVARGADACVAFPLQHSKGTWDCARKALAAGIPTFVATL